MRLKPRRRDHDAKLLMFDCRHGIPEAMRSLIDQGLHVHGFDEERGFCLFGEHGTVRFGETVTTTGGVTIELRGSRRPRVTVWP
jgi:hypothetical protein